MSNKKCPLCGSRVTYMGITSLECVGAGCENNPGGGPGQLDFERMNDELHRAIKELAKTLPHTVVKPRISKAPPGGKGIPAGGFTFKRRIKKSGFKPIPKKKNDKIDLD